MKSFYREWLRNVQMYVKISKLAKEVGIRQNLLSLFMKDSAYDYCLSVQKLQLLHDHIVETLSNVT